MAIGLVAVIALGAAGAAVGIEHAASSGNGPALATSSSATTTTVTPPEAPTTSVPTQRAAQAPVSVASGRQLPPNPSSPTTETTAAPAATESLVVPNLVGQAVQRQGGIVVDGVNWRTQPGTCTIVGVSTNTPGSGISNVTSQTPAAGTVIAVAPAEVEAEALITVNFSAIQGPALDGDGDEGFGYVNPCTGQSESSPLTVGSTYSF